jgi:hypothetical protein
MIPIHSRHRRILADVLIEPCRLVVHPLSDPVKRFFIAEGTVFRYTSVDGGVIAANISQRQQ